jgi:predicted transcriptional regulator
MLIKSVGVALLLSLLANVGLFAYLSVVQGQKKAIQGELALCQGAVKQSSESLEKEQKKCKIQEDIVTELSKEQQSLEKDTDDVISKIDLMHTQSPVILKEQVVRHASPKESEQSVQIFIDSKLPDSLVRLLSESCSRAKGSACDSP